MTISPPLERFLKSIPPCYSPLPRSQSSLTSLILVLLLERILILSAYYSLQVYVRHPELAAAKENRDYVLKQVCKAVNTISEVAQGDKRRQTMLENTYDGPGELAAALDDFDVSTEFIVLFFYH